MRRLRKLGGGLLVAIVIAYASLALFLRTSAFREIVREQIAPLFDGDLVLGSVEASPFGSVVIRDATLDHRGRRLLTVSSATAETNLLGLVLGRSHIRKVVIEEGELAYEGAINLDFLRRGDDSERTGDEASGPTGSSAEPAGVEPDAEPEPDPEPSFPVLEFRNVTVRRDGQALVERGIVALSRQPRGFHVTASDVVVCGVPIEHLSVTIIDSGRSLFLYDLSLSALHGQANGYVRLRSDGTPAIQGELRVTGVSLEKIGAVVRAARAELRGDTEPESRLAGTISGSVSFSGSEPALRSIEAASPDLRIEDARLASIPLALTVFNVLRFELPGETSFTHCESHLRLHDGVFYTDETSLAGNRYSVHLEGSVGLDGRLDLDVLGAPTPARSLPGRVLGAIRDAVRDRILRVHIGGTIDEPIVRAAPLAELTGPVTRFAEWLAQ